jgi:hypothetical protein
VTTGIKAIGKLLSWTGLQLGRHSERKKGAADWKSPEASESAALMVQSRLMQRFARKIVGQSTFSRKFFRLAENRGKPEENGGKLTPGAAEKGI